MVCGRKRTYGCPYTQYYLNQAGGSLNHFTGTRNQLGYHQGGRGLGSIFKSLSRIAIPLLKSAGLYLGKKALSTGTNIFRDVMVGHDPKKAAKDRLKETGSNILSDALNKLQSGSGPRKRGGRKRKNKTSNKKSYKKKRTLAINSSVFD